MEVIITLFAVIAWILLFPFVRFFIKRVSFYIRLSRACKKLDAKCYGTKFMWLFSTRHSQTCDFYVEMCDVVYSVKFFESIIEDAEIKFINATTYSVINFKWCLYLYRWIFLEPKVHKLPKYNFEYKIKNEFITQNIVPIMIILPLPRFYKIKQSGYSDLDISDGTVVSDTYTIYSGKGFLKQISDQKTI